MEESIFIKDKTQLSTKQNDTELAALNKALNTVGFSPKTTTPGFREMLESLVTFINENVNEALPDTEKQEQEISRLKELTQELQNTIDEKDKSIVEFQQSQTSESNENAQLASRYQIEAEKLQQQIEAKIAKAHFLSPGADALLNEVSQKLSVKPSVILNDYVLKYNVRQLNKMFHPFVVSKKQAVAIVEQAENAQKQEVQCLEKEA